MNMCIVLHKIIPLLICICMSNVYSTINQQQIDRYSTLKYAVQLQHDNISIPINESIEYYCNLLREIIEDTKKLNHDVNNNTYGSTDEELISNGYETPNGLLYFFRTIAFFITDRLLLKFPQDQRRNIRKQIINFHRKYFVTSGNTNIPSGQYNTALDQLYKEFRDNIIPPKKPN